MIRKVHFDKNVNLNDTNEVRTIELAEFEGDGCVVAATIQSHLVEGTWGTAVVTIKKANDRGTLIGLDSATTFTATGQFKTTTEVRTCGFLALQVTTAEGAAGVADFHVCLLISDSSAT